MTHQFVLEVAVYQSSQNEQLQATAHQALSKFPGFLNSLALKSHDETLWADLILWRSSETALAAASSIGVDKNLDTFVGSISKIFVFSHYDGFDFELFEKLSTSAVIELAGYETKSAEDVSLRDKIHDALQKGKVVTMGIAANRIGLSTEGTAPNAMDVIGWQSLGDFGKAPETVLCFYPELGSSMQELMKNMTIFSTFRKSVI